MKRATRISGAGRLIPLVGLTIIIGVAAALWASGKFTPARAPAAEGATPVSAPIASKKAVTVAPSPTSNTAVGTPVPPASPSPATTARTSTAPAFTLDPDRPDSKVEGYAPLPRGGEGGRVVEVTSLEDAGPGTFRAALADVKEKGGPARIVFRVGGPITAKTGMSLSTSRVTIDGSTAPAPGITLDGTDIFKQFFDENGYVTELFKKKSRGARKFRPGTKRSFRGPMLTFSGVEDVIIRDIRFRGTPVHSLQLFGSCKRVLVDHISSTECSDGAFSINGGAENITVQWSLFAGNNLTTRVRGDKISFHHCLFTENRMRHPLARGGGVRDLRNNVIINWYTAGIQTNPSEARQTPMNIVNNFFSVAASNKPATKILDAGPAFPMHISGNIGPGRHNLNARSTRARPHEEPGVTTQTAAEAKELVLKYAGARPRDERDQAYAEGRLKYIHRMKEEWTLPNPWWERERGPGEERDEPGDDEAESG